MINKQTVKSSKLLLLISGFWIFSNLLNPIKLMAADMYGSCGTGAIDTAVGCVPVLADTTGTSFANWLLKWAVGFGGGIAFLLIVYASFMIMTSAGNPERLKAGHELMTSAISGILLLIFSVFILNLIGVNILGIFT